MVSTLAMTDALAKLMIAKGILTERLLAAQQLIEWANAETKTVNPQVPTVITSPTQPPVRLRVISRSQ